MSKEWDPRLLELEEALGADLADQADAVHRLAKLIRKSYAGLKAPERPIAACLVVGAVNQAPTLASGLARFFGSFLVQIDLNRYREKHELSRLITSNGGMISYYIEGELTEPVLNNPNAVVLLNNVEMAHFNVLSLLLCIIKNGGVFDGPGRWVSFSSSILLLATSVGSDFTLASVSDRCPIGIQHAIEAQFPPELLRLIDDYVWLR
jgi:ATP-dependent Clp protease ATP-binding subunit ClpA